MGLFQNKVLEQPQIIRGGSLRPLGAGGWGRGVAEDPNGGGRLAPGVRGWSGGGAKEAAPPRAGAAGGRSRRSLGCALTHCPR
jgi:hypothetical protein